MHFMLEKYFDNNIELKPFFEILVEDLKEKNIKCIY